MRGKKILALLRDRSMTSREMAEAMVRSRTSVSSTMTKLVKLGYVVMDGYGEPVSGQNHPPSLWKATALGLETLDAFERIPEPVPEEEVEHEGPLHPAPDIRLVLASQPPLVVAWNQRAAA